MQMGAVYEKPADKFPLAFSACHLSFNREAVIALA